MAAAKRKQLCYSSCTYPLKSWRHPFSWLQRSRVEGVAFMEPKPKSSWPITPSGHPGFWTAVEGTISQALLLLNNVSTPLFKEEIWNYSSMLPVSGIMKQFSTLRLSSNILLQEVVHNKPLSQQPANTSPSVTKPQTARELAGAEVVLHCPHQTEQFQQENYLVDKIKNSRSANKSTRPRLVNPLNLKPNTIGAIAAPGRLGHATLDDTRQPIVIAKWSNLTALVILSIHEPRYWMQRDCIGKNVLSSVEDA